MAGAGLLGWRREPPAEGPRLGNFASDPAPRRPRRPRPPRPFPPPDLEPADPESYPSSGHTPRGPGLDSTFTLGPEASAPDPGPTADSFLPVS